MGPAAQIASIVVVVIATATFSFGQPPAEHFDLLADRLRVGQPIRVTDTVGREIHGRFEGVSGRSLLVKTDVLRTFDVRDVQRVRARDRDPLKNGTLIGLAIGGGLGIAWCTGAIADDSGDIDARVECAEGFTVFPALGALVGLAIDAVTPGRLRVLYPQPAVVSRSRAALVPILSARKKGAALAVTF